MRFLLVFCMVAACVSPALAAENWFLPYITDAHTVALLHCDGEGEEEPGGAGPAFRLAGGAARTPGQFGGGVLLGGGGAMLSAPAHPAFALRADQEFTFELWVRPDGAAEGSLFSIGTRFYLRLQPGARAGAFGYRAAAFPIRFIPLTDLPIARGKWQHVALTHAGDGTVDLYLNGARVATVAHAQEGDYGKGGGCSLGAHDGWTNYFRGAVDEVRLSNCVRRFQPLLSQRSYLMGETVRLLADPAGLPADLERVRVRVLRGAGAPLVQREVLRAGLGGPLFPAADLPAGQHPLEVTFLGAGGRVLSRVETTVGYAGDLPQRLGQRLAAVERAAGAASGKAAPERVASARLLVQSARSALERRDFQAAESRAAAAERVAGALSGGESAYRAAVRRAVRAGASPRDVRLTMSWVGGGPRVAEAIPWARRLGANELAASHTDATPEGLAAWKKAGFRTVLLSGATIHDHAWVKEYPEDGQFGYWVTDPVEAKAAAVEISLASPTWEGTRVSTRFDPRSHWRVVDDAGKPVPAADWEYDAAALRVRLRAAEPGRRYCVYFMVETEGCGNPLLPRFAAHALEKLQTELAAYRGVLDTYWFDDLAFAYPGSTPQGAWDWESYTLAAHPEVQERFHRETGIPFDPAWLVMPPRTIEVVPAPGYLAWMEWVQGALKPWLARVGEACRGAGAASWLYWGDCHVGMEPFRGSLAAGIGEIDKPVADPVSARALVDFPGEARRRLRVEWLFPRVAASDTGPERLWKCWLGSRRGLLMKPPTGLYWMPFQDVVAASDEGIREDMVETMAEINDEFRLIGDHLAGEAAFTHDIDVYVLNAWGSVYSWRPWGAQVLAPLADVPVRVHFLSFAEVEKGGIPAGADVLFLYGLPGSAWSGGRWWESGKVAAAVRGFAERGGGIVALQAPSQLPGTPPSWALGDLLGVRPEGAADYRPVSMDASQLADTGVVGEDKDAAGAVLLPMKASGPQWPWPETAAVPGLQESVRVAPAAGARLLYALRAGEGPAGAGVVLSQPGKGRVAYCAGWSAAPAFRQWVRRAVFWAARREADLPRLAVAGSPDLFLYAYPTARMLVLASEAAAAEDATLRCDPALFGLRGRLRLVDVATGERVWEGVGEQLRAGVTVRSVPRCVRLLRVLPTGP